MDNELKSRTMLRVRTHGGTYTVDAEDCHSSQDGTLSFRKDYKTVHITKDWVAVCRVGSPEDLATTQLMSLPGCTMLSVRARNKLAANGWRVLSDIADLSDEDVEVLSKSDELEAWLLKIRSELRLVSSDKETN